MLGEPLVRVPSAPYLPLLLQSQSEEGLNHLEKTTIAHWLPLTWLPCHMGAHVHAVGSVCTKSDF